MNEEEANIEATCVAIRERLMEYYKGMCITPLVSRSNVALQMENQPRERYTYARREIQNEARASIYIDKLKMATLTRVPLALELNNEVMDRSKQLRSVKAKIEAFMSEYLGGVNVTYKEVDSGRS